jgi:hypothetical protein
LQDVKKVSEKNVNIKNSRVNVVGFLKWLLTFCGLAKVAVRIKLLKDWQGWR